MIIDNNKKTKTIRIKMIITQSQVIPGPTPKAAEMLLKLFIFN